MKLPQKSYLPLGKQLSHSRHRVKRESYNNRRPHRKELHRTNGRTPQTTLHPTHTFRNRHYANSTELSKFIWHLKDNNTDFKLKWSILTSAAAYSNKSKRCNLCLAEKFFIIKAEKSTLVNKRSELVSKCRHENKFYLMNLKADHT